ncbi:MAG: histidinol dehydrogenase [Verrucomicrobiota bacterium]|nr:histidinol dehydrogenase [Verrucomicrobiota bacterium]
MSARIVRANSPIGARLFQKFMRRPAFNERAESVAMKVLADIRRRGEPAVLEYVRRFDGVSLGHGRLRVSDREIRAAARQVPPAFKRAVRAADRRILAFARAGMRTDWRMRAPQGGWLGEKFVPLDRVGACIPGGKAPLASTALMTITLARAAGVQEIVACTPPDRQGVVNPCVLYALDVAGATEVYRVGGIQAIGFMAYGTRSVPQVQKIVGPGGVFVTAAKRLVYGHVALDLVAGPSEIAVLADDSADPRHVAADLLSQAEHGTGWEKALLVTDSPALAAATRQECARQAASLARQAVIRRVIETGMLFIVVDRLDQGVELVNRFAPEHLELMVRRPEAWVRKIRAAGAIFVGPWTPESAGDFVAGPSHVLPTGGAAAMFSGLTTDDFRRRSSLLAFTRTDLRETLPVIEQFAVVEGLDGHARSARIRFESRS